MQKIKLTCEQCGKDFERDKGEYTRSQKLNRKSFCSKNCACIYGNQILPNRGIKNLQRGAKDDRLSPFRWYMGRCRVRTKDVNVTPQILSDIWDKQKGICPLTGWELLLPRNSLGFIAKGNRSKHASLDRIDSSQGYVQGNVRFVSLIANYAKHDFNDEDLIKFCKAVTEHRESCMV